MVVFTLILLYIDEARVEILGVDAVVCIEDFLIYLYHVVLLSFLLWADHHIVPYNDGIVRLSTQPSISMTNNGPSKKTDSFLSR